MGWGGTKGFWDQVFHTSRGVVDRDARVMVDDAEQAIAESKSGTAAYGFYSSVVVVMDRFRLNLHVDDLGHSLIFGPPGSGKSVHLALLAAGELPQSA